MIVIFMMLFKKLCTKLYVIVGYFFASSTLIRCKDVLYILANETLRKACIIGTSAKKKALANTFLMVSLSATVTHLIDFSVNVSTYDHVSAFSRLY